MKKFIISFLLIIGIVVAGGTTFAQNDRLKDAFNKSHQPQNGNDPYASDVEANGLFKNFGGSAGGESILTRTARFMLRLAVILAIPLLLYVGIKVMLATGDTGRLNAALKEGGMIAAGLLIALLSVAIIYLITSLTRSSIGNI